MCLGLLAVCEGEGVRWATESVAHLLRLAAAVFGACGSCCLQGVCGLATAYGCAPKPITKTSCRPLQVWGAAPLEHVIARLLPPCITGRVCSCSVMQV